ncbi:hypothetical protein GA0115255_1232014 [Streptomyces sp. Ncost-T6T-2b]|nr:hypothetical protein GA0115255_1232014 [Streptomyces sp. Ncost-T6T-2b]
MRVAGLCGSRVARRAATAASGMSLPRDFRWPIAPVSNCHRCARSPSCLRSWLIRRPCSFVSTAHATAPEFWRIQRAWNADEVG